MKKLYKILPAAAMAAALITGCAAPSTVKTSADSQATAIQKEFDAYKALKEAEIDSLNKQIAELMSDPVSPSPTEAEKSPDLSAIAFNNRPAGMLYFPLISKTPDNYEEIILSYVAIEPQKSVSEKVSMLADSLSRTIFNNLPMETAITEDGGSKLLTVNLVGRDQWYQTFQGSTGGGINSYALIETFLQRSFKNEWVDALKITVDNEVPGFEHAPGIDGIIAR